MSPRLDHLENFAPELSSSTAQCHEELLAHLHENYSKVFSESQRLDRLEIVAKAFKLLDWDGNPVISQKNWRALPAGTLPAGAREVLGRVSAGQGDALQPLYPLRRR